MYPSSLTFIIAVLPMLLLFYYFCPGRVKYGFLLFASLLIYSWGSPVRVLYLSAYICYDYGMGLLLEKCRKHGKFCTAMLAGSAVLQAALLMIIRQTDGEAGFAFFPMGIAVYTLQGMGYLIAVYRNRCPATVNFLNLALYLSFFPTLYAGPFLSFREFSQQLGKKRCNVLELGEGMEIFIRGLAEKVVLADAFGSAFRELRQTDAASMSMLTAWLTTVTFSLYLYFDLLGFSEMARGLGRCLGFSLPRNFRHPFFASGLTSFMQSWNITLVLWFQTNFRHFLFGRHQKKWRKYMGLVLMWMLIGVWYGTKPQLLLWGLLIGLLLTMEPLLLKPFFQHNYVLGIVYTTVLMQFLWVLFYADGLGEACRYWVTMLGFGSSVTDSYGIYFFTSYAALLLLGLYAATDLFRNITERIGRSKFGRFFHTWTPLVHGLLLIFCMASIIHGENTVAQWLQI
jgi:alginate O-acetyltransferase complex protein AlgI